MKDLLAQIDTLDDLARIINEADDYPRALIEAACAEHNWRECVRGEDNWIARDDQEVIACGFEGPNWCHVLMYDGEDPVRISMDNGHTFCTPEAVLERFTMEYVFAYMNECTRELVHEELAPCSDVDFLRRYLQLATCDLIIG